MLDPWVLGFFSLIIGILGIALAVYFYTHPPKSTQKVIEKQEKMGATLDSIGRFLGLNAEKFADNLEEGKKIIQEAENSHELSTTDELMVSAYKSQLQENLARAVELWQRVFT